jgi:hypothetical protein
VVSVAATLRVSQTRSVPYLAVRLTVLLQWLVEKIQQLGVKLLMASLRI